MKNKLRILHAYKFYYPFEGGIPTIIKQITQGLKLQTHQEVLTTHTKFFGRNEMIDDISVCRLGSYGELFSLPLTPHYPAVLWKQAHDFDIVDYHFPMPWVDAAVALYWPKRTKLIVHWHSKIISQTKIAHMLQPMIQRCLKRADRIVVADSDHIMQSPWLDKFKEKCVVIPHGINSDDWQNLNTYERNQISHLQKNHGRYILAVGRLVDYKGFPVLIKAMQQVMPHYKLLIVGEGCLETKLKLLVEKLKLNERVHFCGRVSHQQLKCLYHGSDLFALPSITENESFGIVQLEAMACAKPIVNTRLNSAVPLVARHEQEALTVSPNSPDELAIAINKVLSDHELGQFLGIKGRQRVQTIFSEKKFLNDTLELYNSLYQN